jgi:hypothetical protein
MSQAMVNLIRLGVKLKINDTDRHFSRTINGQLECSFDPAFYEVVSSKKNQHRQGGTDDQVRFRIDLDLRGDTVYGNHLLRGWDSENHLERFVPLNSIEMIEMKTSRGARPAAIIWVA